MILVGGGGGELGYKYFLKKKVFIISGKVCTALEKEKIEVAVFTKQNRLLYTHFCTTYSLTGRRC